MFCSNLFKKKNYSTNIVNNISSKISSFEELTTEEQEYVSKLKNEYISFYDTENSYINLDKELFNEVKMYQDLSLDIMHNDHFGNIASSIIDSKKLIYYSHKITEINNTLKYKYIALCELRKDKKYLTKHLGLYVLGKRKINILKALDHQTNIINNMFFIVDQKITDYCACAIANYPKNIDKSAKKELENRHDEVEKDYQDLFNTSINLDNNLSNTDKTTYMEILIDKFLYENKDLIDKLKEQLDLIANSEIKDETTQQEIIDNLMKIKIYYQIFYKYGRNLIDDKDIEDLYQIIFNVYTYFPLDCNFSEYCNSLPPNKEKSTYIKIIESKLEIFKLGKSKIFETSNIPKEQLIKWADENYFKSDGIYYYFTRPFHDYRLKLLLLMDYNHGIEQFFESIVINLKYNDLTDIFFNLPYDTLDQNFTRYSLYKLLFGMYLNIDSPVQEQMLSLENHIGAYNYNKIKKFLYEVIDELEIFRKIYKNKIFFNNVPEGVKYFSTKHFDSYIKEYCLNKTTTLPNSVNKVDITFNYSENIKIKCPDKLEELKINIMCDEIDLRSECPHATIILPSNLDKFSIHKASKSKYDFYFNHLTLIHNYKILDLDYNDLYYYFYKLIYALFENKHNNLSLIFRTMLINDPNNKIRTITIDDLFDKKVETLKGVDNLAKIIADYIIKNKVQINNLINNEPKEPKTLIKK